MRKIIVISMISLDGVMQAPGGPAEDRSGGFEYGGWTVGYSDETFSKIMHEELKQTDYLLGRKTFEMWSKYWSQHSDFWSGINEGTKYVMSNTMKESDWKNSVFINSVDDIKKIKNSEGSDIQVWGSSEIVHFLLKNDLVDELKVKVYPIILGNGKKLFDNNSIPSAFTLTDSVVTSKGVFIGNYKRAGDIVTGNVEG